MSRSEKSVKQSRKVRNDDLFRRADQHWERGELRSALRLFLAAAKAGDRSSQLNVGYFYNRGLGVRPERSSALFWYKRAYRNGDGCAASNIGTIWRDEQKPKRALYWFRQAVKLGDADANLEIAKIFLRNEKDHKKSIPYLKRACRSNQVTEEKAEEARRLLKRGLRLHPSLRTSGLGT